MVLSKQGWSTPTGLPFTAARVAGIRERAAIPAAPRTASCEGGMSINEAARELRVSTQTIRRWLEEGLLPAEQTTEHAHWRIRLTDEIRARRGVRVRRSWTRTRSRPQARRSRPTGDVRHRLAAHIQADARRDQPGGDDHLGLLAPVLGVPDSKRVDCLVNKIRNLAFAG